MAILMKNEVAGVASAADARWMRQALGLAEKSVGLASPNPVVGCVLVQGETVVGRGAHIYDELDHAEVAALKQAGGEARGATAYVTLEPCSHIGRTGPCAEALVQAGVGRVVVATVDPNPLVSGRGIALLREAGIAVTVGVLAEQARQINDGFARFIRRKLPFVTLKAGLSLDGRIAPAPLEAAAGVTDYLTSGPSLAAVQRMRHASDAILCGIGTVLDDNPLLTDRSGLARRRPLLRVVLDSALRLPLDSRLVESAQGDLLLYTTDARNARADALRKAGVEIEEVRTIEGGARVDLRAVLVSLGERRGVLNVLAEGGSRLNRVLLAEELVDKLCLFYAPMFLGEDGVPLVAGGGRLKPQLSGVSIGRSGEDFCFEAYLRDPWR
jgi:diaminohydroxyphosphoribosylaminopyrimidine deaminase/5-amino-6-(5-phosphoribosylamino)uracil reductase